MINLITDSFQLNNISGIIFDKDGTLTDSSFYWSEIIKRRSKKIINDLFLENEDYLDLIKVMGLDFNSNKLLPEGPIAIKSRKEVILKIKNHFQNKNIIIKSDYLEDIFKKIHKDFAREAHKYILPIYPAKKLIEKLQNFKVKLFLITSDTKSNADETIRVLDLENSFEYVIGGDSKFGNKSLGNGCAYICENFLLDSKEVICIGDTPVDHQMAVNANLKASLLVESGQIDIKTLSQFSAYCVKDLSSIIIE